jgi:preprotein translocase subunit SecG
MKKSKQRIKKSKTHNNNMQKTKLLLAILLFGILCTTVNAIEYQISAHSVQIQVATEGKDKVTEKFFINFPSSEAKIEFREKSSELGTSLEEWKQFNQAFIPGIGENILNKKISYNESDKSYLQISYELAEPIMATAKEADRMIEYSMKINYFNSFYKTGQWVIPEGTTISIELPAGAEIKKMAGPQSTITKNGSRQTINWQGYKTSNELAVNYILWKKMEPVIDLNEFTNFMTKTTPGQLGIGAIIIILVIIILERKKISGKIEEFVENNSIIKEE